MTSDRKKPGVAFWAAVVVVVLALGALIVWLSLGLIGDLIWKYKLFPIG